MSKFINFFVLCSMSTQALADATQSASNPMGSFVMIGLFLVLGYFMIWRPQNKRAKQHRDLIRGIQVGDEVLTTGGLVGKIAKVSDTFLLVSVASNVDISIQKNAVVHTFPQGTLKSMF